MEINEIYKKMKEKPRMLVTVDLWPVQGDTIQPTGFPEIGAAVYETSDGTRMLLVESAQSMANWLESTILKNKSPEIIDDLKGLSYVQVNLASDQGFKSQTSSLVEPHRINSPYIMTKKSDFVNEFKQFAGYEKGVYPDWNKMAKALFKYDINSLIHGAFLSNLEDGGRFRVPRALSSFVEAEGVKEVQYGGAKISQIDPKGDYKVENGVIETSAYSNIPYSKMDYTASKITGYFNLDVSLLQSYNLGESATNLLLGLSMYKILKLLNSNLKLRTACDLKVKKVKIDEPDMEFPDMDELLKNIQENIKKCSDMFAVPPVTEIAQKLVINNSKDKNSNSSSDEN